MFSLMEKKQMQIISFKRQKKVIVSLFAAFIVVFVTLIKVSVNYVNAQTSLPNIMIIIMDTVRQDRLSCYNYDRDTTPNLKKLAEKSRVYYNTYSTSSWTNPAHASLFTGLYPIAHNTTQENWKLSQNLKTLAEILRDVGFETFGIVENGILGKHNGFDQGFSRYYETWRKNMSSDSENIALSYFRKCIRERNTKKPFFMFVNFISPHNPYNAPFEFRNRFVSNPSIEYNSNLWQWYYLGKMEFTEEELQHLNELYEAEILYVDYLIGKIINELKSNNLWGNTVFIITSDHGENIGDHDHMDHVFSLYESTIKIPLIIYYPKLFLPHSKDWDVVQLTDIFPTVLRIVGIDSEVYPSQGFDLLKKNSRKDRIIFTEYYYPNQAMRAFKEQFRSNPNLDKYKRRIKSIIYENKKLVWGTDGKYELYDLAIDPDEEHNLIDKKINLKQEMLNKLETIVSKFTLDDEKQSGKPGSILDKETEEALRSLGYLP